MKVATISNQSLFSSCKLMILLLRNQKAQITRNTVRETESGASDQSDSSI